MNPPGLRRAVAVLAAVAAVVGLSGCFKVNHDMEIKADGTGSASLHVEVNKKAVEAMARSFDVGGAVPPMEDVFKPVDKTFPDGTRVTAVNNADRSTVDASFDFSGADDYGRRMQQIGDAVATDPDDSMPTDGSIQIRRNGDRMDVSLDVGSATEGSDQFDLASLQGVLDPSALPSVVFTITMPGKVVTTNGQERGRTVTWDLLSKTAPTTLTVTSEVEKDGLPAWAIPAGGGLLFLSLLALLAVLLTQRRRSARPVGPPPYQPGAWPPAGDAPGPGTFFPPPPGAAPGPPVQEPVGWSQPPPGPPPPSGPGGWSQPPPAGGPPPPASAAGTWSPSPSPSAVSAGEPEAGSPPAQPPPPQARPWAPAPPASPVPPSTTWVIKPEPPAEDPLPWRVPDATASPAAPPEPQLPPEPEPEPEPEPTVATPAASDIEAGWYADPAGGSGARYWDGQRWTEHTR